MTLVGLCVFALGLATRRGALVIAMELMRVRGAVGGGGAVALASHVKRKNPTMVVVVCSKHFFRSDWSW